MVINKRFIHFETFVNFNSQKLSANEENTKYRIGVSGAEEIGQPDIPYQSICLIKDVLKIWTHDALYNCSEVNLALYLTREEFEEYKELILAESTRNDTQEAKIANLQEGIAENTRVLEILNGSGEGSIKDEVEKGIASAIASSPEDFEKLQEIADFIESDPLGAAELSTSVSSHETRLSQIEEDFVRIVFMNEEEYNSLLNKNSEVLYMLYDA